MKYIKLFILLFITGFSSCNKFGDKNTDPTQSANLDPAIEVAYAQQKFSGDVGVQERAGLILTEPLVQQYGEAGQTSMASFTNETRHICLYSGKTIILTM